MALFLAHFPAPALQLIFAGLSVHDTTCLCAVLAADPTGTTRSFHELQVEAFSSQLRLNRKPASLMFEWMETVDDDGEVFSEALRDYPSEKLCELARHEREELSENDVVLRSLACMLSGDGSGCSAPFVSYVARGDGGIRETGMILVDQLARKGIVDASGHTDFLWSLLCEGCSRNDNQLFRTSVSRLGRCVHTSDREALRTRASECLVVWTDARYAANGDDEGQEALIERIDALIADFGADPSFTSPELYFTPLSKACTDGLEKVARHLVKRHGVRPTTSPDDVLRCCLKTARFSSNRTLELFIIRELYRRPRQRATQKDV